MDRDDFEQWCEYENYRQTFKNDPIKTPRKNGGEKPSPVLDSIFAALAALFSKH